MQEKWFRILISPEVEPFPTKKDYTGFHLPLFTFNPFRIGCGNKIFLEHANFIMITPNRGLTTIDPGETRRKKCVQDKHNPEGD